MSADIIIFFILLFVVAFLYASVGHGGASGYLALMALFSISPQVMRPTALLLNLFVSGIGFIQFYRSGYFKWKVFLPFALTSIPFSFLGGMMEVDAALYKKILGFLLIIPIVRFFFFPNVDSKDLKTSNIALSLIIGATIGFLSGMIGIGGGIILSPVLLLLRWTDQKQTAALSALFIFVNSLSGLGGQLLKGIHLSPDMLTYVGVAFAGGALGAYVGAFHFSKEGLKYVLASVLSLAAYKLIFN